MSEISSDLIRLYEIASYDHSSWKAPVIGITIDAIDSRNCCDSSTYSEYPWYAIGRRYSEAIVRCGGIPVLVCNNLSSISRYVDVLDGLLLSGTAVDIDPVFYGETFRHKTTATRPIRTQFDIAITRKMMIRGKPILGINYGCELINVMYGGTLCQHIIEELPAAEIHIQEPLLVFPQHKIAIMTGTKVYDAIVASDAAYASSITNPSTKYLEIEVNSFHHQCIQTVGDGLAVTARAPSGIVEGIEAMNVDFCVGTQWHPEFLLNVVDYAIFQAFIEAAVRSAESLSS